MKRIRKSRAARILSWVLTVVMVVPLLCDAFRPMAAHAQTPAQTGTVQTVIVIDFANRSGTLGESLARRATDDVAVALAESGRFDVLGREEVARQAADMGLRKPYDRVALSKLASALGASAIVSGEVSYVHVDTKATPKAVTAGLKVRIEEATAGDLIAGAAQIGEARARPGGGDNEALAGEAVDNAATLAVRQIVNSSLPEGTVISTVGGGAAASRLDVLINRGSRDGVKEGMEMIVLRDKQRVGKIQVTSVYPADSQARVVDNILGIRPEDKVRAVFPMPDFAKDGSVKAPRRNGRNSMRGLGQILLAVVVGVAIVAAVAGGSSSTVTGVVAEADIQNAQPVVRITWRDNIWGASTREYHIWRQPDAPYNFQGTPVAAVASQRQYFDQPAPYSFWDGTRGFLQAPLPQGGGGTGSTQEAEVVTPAAGIVPGFTVGRSYNYVLNAVIRRLLGTANTGGGGGGGTDQAFEDVDTGTVRSGQVTPINQPLLGPNPADQAQNVNLTAFNPTWLSRQGADQFVVEVSTDRAFMNRNLILQFPLVFSTAPNADGVTQTLPSPANLTSSEVLLRDPVFANFVNQQPGAIRPTLFWRVGARNSQDSPGPVDWLTKDPKSGNRAFRYVYSQARSFTPADMPPPPP
ncbi:MAG: hypothetical protein IT208_14400 [Chthonomonadales bacterium]|nr:hypothetical protein [Chthonomonadales bacterium]